jgi:hypothetical protein
MVEVENLGGSILTAGSLEASSREFGEVFRAR